MTEINIPSITIDTPLPYNLNLRAEGQPLQGLHIRKHSWSRLAEVMIWETRARWHGGVGEVINYTVRTVGFAPQTKRDKTFHVTERAAMVRFVNEWIAKTVAAGIEKKAEQKVEKEVRDNNQRAWVAKQIEEAGGIEARRQQIVRESEAIAAKETFQYESDKVYAAIMTAIITRTPIALDIETRDKIIARYEQYVNESWSAKRYIETQMQELDKYLAETKQEEAA